MNLELRECVLEWVLFKVIRTQLSYRAYEALEPISALSTLHLEYTAIAQFRL